MFRLCEQQNQKQASLLSMLSMENVRDGCLSHISEYTTINEPIRFAYSQRDSSLTMMNNGENVFFPKMIQCYSYLRFQALSTEYSKSSVQMEGHFAANSSEKTH